MSEEAPETTWFQTNITTTTEEHGVSVVGHLY